MSRGSDRGEPELKSEELPGSYGGRGKNHSENGETLPKKNMKIVWLNVLIMGYLHFGGLLGTYYLFTGQCYWQTIVLGFIFAYIGAFGVTCGAHRLWAHKAYRAKLPLRILLAYMFTTACQNSIHEWCRDHRVHHKFSETDADPHNAKRGFFFAHVGWLLMKKHEDVKVKGRKVDMSDLEADPVVMFQKTYFVPLTILAAFVIPTVIPWYFWGEDGNIAYYITLCRYCISLNATWLVNSAAHLWGYRSYDANINPAENLFVSIVSNGEGWHNFHHVFPWDYKAAELGAYKHNLSTALIDFFALIGWASDLKTVPQTVINQRVARTGDGTHYSVQNNSNANNIKNVSFNKSNFTNGKAGASDTNRNYIHSHEDANSWGWDDEETNKEDKEVTLIHYKTNLD